MVHQWTGEIVRLPSSDCPYGEILLDAEHDGNALGMPVFRAAHKFMAFHRDDVCLTLQVIGQRVSVTRGIPLARHVRAQVDAFDGETWYYGEVLFVNRVSGYFLAMVDHMDVRAFGLLDTRSVNQWENLDDIVEGARISFVLKPNPAPEHEGQPFMADVALEYDLINRQQRMQYRDLFLSTLLKAGLKVRCSDQNAYFVSQHSDFSDELGIVLDFEVPAEELARMFIRSLR